jgi:hypothetical protein
MTTRVRPDRSWAAPIVLAAAAASLYLILQPMSADLAAQTYRVTLFRQHGLTLWDGQWYGGHHIPGYSVLFPPVAALVGVRWAGAIAAVAAAWLFAVLTRREFGDRARLGASWFAFSTFTTLLSGRLAFGFGMTMGLAALLALQRDKRVLGIALGVLTALSSPVAGVFLALAGAAWWLGTRRGAAAALVAAAVLPVAGLSILFPEGGVEPFSLGAYWPAPACALIGYFVIPREEKVLRAGVWVFLFVATAAFFISSPLGSNVMRLGPLVAGPLAACAFLHRRPRVLLALVVPLLWWQWSAAYKDVHTASKDPAVHAAYFQPLLGFLRVHQNPSAVPARVEIPFTRDHWEAAYVAPYVPLARGWERQLDTSVDKLFYQRPLTAKRYHTWLHQLGVKWVALPDSELDYSSQQEAALIRSGLPYLRLVWSSAHWSVYRVTDAQPLAKGSATLVAQTATSETLYAHRPGRTLLHVRYTPYWQLSEGLGCVSRSRTGWTELQIFQPGPVKLTTSWSPGRIASNAPRCRRLPKIEIGPL